MASPILKPSHALQVVRLAFIEKERCEFELHAPCVVLWESATSECCIGGQGRAKRFVPTSGAMDLLAPGGYTLENEYGARIKWVLVVTPQEESGAWEGDLNILAKVSARLQFRDRPLQRMICALRDHMKHGERNGAIYSELLSITIVESLTLAGGAQRTKLCDASLPTRIRLRLRELIDARMESPPSIEEMASFSGLSMTRFLKAFRVSFGDTPHQYLLSRRIEEAKRSLRDDSSSLSQIAVSLGFADHAHFTTQFRERTGITPREWRERKYAA